VSSVSTRCSSPNGLGDGVNPAAASAGAYGITVNATTQMAALRVELDAFEAYVTGLAPRGP